LSWFTRTVRSTRDSSTAVVECVRLVMPRLRRYRGGDVAVAVEVWMDCPARMRMVGGHVGLVGAAWYGGGGSRGAVLVDMVVSRYLG
jgi:hypothetical protein